ncbi:unnamed protein product [Clonostachys rosea]|uniref:CHAT domain-containing protein n=1 Tax=Bionectria ochroleuca TaxID=29856 RepID=A0ABY6U4G2_BIOOC|nr:unnamed protein product [Clonostachys rosea]
MSGLEDAICTMRKCLRLKYESVYDYAYGLELQAELLVKHFHQTGTVSALEEAIDNLRKIFQIPSQDCHKDGVGRILLVSCFCLLAQQQSSRGRGSNMEDYYDEAASLASSAFESLPTNWLRQDEYLTFQASRLEERYWVSHDLRDLKRAINLGNRAVDLTPKGHPSRLFRLEWLEDFLDQKVAIFGDSDDIHKMVQISRLILDEAPQDDQETLSFRYLSLGEKLEQEFNQKGTINSLREAIQLSMDALQLRTNDYHKSDHFRSVGTWYASIHQKTHDTADLESSIFFFQRNLEVLSSGIDTISATAGIASFAAGLAFIVGKGPLAALELLEKSRNVFASSLEDLRVEVSDELQQLHPGLAADFMRLRYQVSRPGITLRQSQADGGRAKAAWQLDHVIEEISRKPGFDDFLMSPNEEDIRESSRSGPVVIITTCPMRCDAIIIQPHQVRGIVLPHLSHGDILGNLQKGNINNLKVLEWLWDVLASPILDALEFTQSPGDGEAWPRIWWIPIGPLTKFPIHAAGYHRYGTNNTVMDRVASSYSTSVKSMIQTRRRATLTESKPERAVLVSVPQTTGHASLKFVKEEAIRVGSICRSMGLDVIEPRPRMEDVASHMAGCKIFHFAGHGSVNSSDPSLSQLLLEDWKTEEFTVAMIQEMNLRSGSPFLAYLSACGTGRIRQSSHLDENTHLISAFRIAGFRHVIGTLWEVNDECCVRVAERTYEEMLHSGISDDAVCLGLHKATREARDQWEQRAEETRGKFRQQEKTKCGSVDMDRDIEECDVNDDHQVPEWVPYVHFGV